MVRQEEQAAALVVLVAAVHMFNIGLIRHHYHQLLELQWVRREQRGRVREWLEVREAHLMYGMVHQM